MDSSKITQSFPDRRTQILDSCLDAICQTPCINLTLTTTPEDIKRKKEHHSIVMSSDIITYDEELQDLCSKAEAIIVTLSDTSRPKDTRLGDIDKLSKIIKNRLLMIAEIPPDPRILANVTM